MKQKLRHRCPECGRFMDEKTKEKTGLLCPVCISKIKKEKDKTKASLQPVSVELYSSVHALQG